MLKHVGIFVIVLTITNCILAAIPPFEDETNFEFNYFENKFDLSDNEVESETKSSGKFRTKSDRSVYPTRYQIKLRPIFDADESDSERFTIPSSILIEVNCVAATKSIRLDSKEIRILENSTRVISKTRNQDISIATQNVNTEDDEYEITLANSLEAGESYELHIDYVATIFRDRLDGIYLSNYTNPNTKEMRYLATSHFEPDGARQAFPCFDEPDLKAVFEISIGRREGYNSLANVDLNRSEPILDLPGWYWDHYNPTVKMSSYLVAIVVSDYTSATADSKYMNGRPVKIWAAPHHISKNGGDYAAETAGKILDFYESYFDRKYPLPKMDSAAIPHFSAGAMENYGLNTYREKYLLYFNGETTESARYGVCDVVAHELAHQWFGNLVTCKTWSQLWLNEGFAAYVQNIGATAACPEFESWNKFVPSTLQTAFIVDQSPETHPIVNETHNVAKFTKITYNKGASLIRMMQGFLGEATLQKGLRSYLKAMAFGNAHQDDLFNALTQAAREDGTISNYTSVNEIMDSWTHKHGFPLVRVDIGGTNKIYLSQELYVKPTSIASIPTLATKNAEDERNLWWIPVKIATSKKPEFKNRRLDFWIPSTIGTFLRSNVDLSDWIIVNPDSVGYYRVLYDDTLSTRIQKQLNTDPSKISSSSRSQLLDDYLSFAFADYIPIEKALEMTTYLSKETEFNAWNSVFRQLKRTLNLFSNTPGFENFQNYLKPKINSVLNSIGYEQKPDQKGIRVINRAQLLDWANALKDEKLYTYAAGQFNSWMDSPNENRIPLDLQPTIYCAAVSSGVNEDLTWNFVQNRYTQEEPGRQKDLLSNALSCSTNSTKIETLLYSTLETNSSQAKIQKADIGPLFQRLAANSNGRQVLFPFIQKEYQALLEFHKGTKVMASVVAQLASFIHAEQDYKDLKLFLETNAASLTSAEKSDEFKRSIATTVEENQAWIAKFYDPMNTWFQKQLNR